jgi:hypothetical protein
MTASLFFSDLKQEEVSIRQYKGKSPLVYREAHFMGAFFAADIWRVQEALPDGRYRPLQILPGTGVAAIHCMEYKDTDIGPYNEVCLSIALRGPARWPPLPPLSILKSLLERNYHAHVAELPVTTEIALYGGLDFFNYPKYLAEISFRETTSRRICTMRDRQTQELILEFEGVKLATRKPQQPRALTLNTYPCKDGRILHARLMINRREAGASLLLAKPSLRLGPHPRSEPFRRLGLGRTLRYDFAPRCEAILFMPELL